MSALDLCTLALRVFEWSVVRQSDLGPGLTVCAKALDVTTKDVCLAVAAWRNPKGHMAVVRVLGRGITGYRIEAYYNTSAPESTDGVGGTDGR